MSASWKMSFKPNRELLNVNFEGYKLSDKSLDVIREGLPCPVAVTQLKEDEFSYQHMRAHTLHNHLHSDPSDPCSVFWCASDGSIMKATLKGESISLENVFSLPMTKLERATNVTMEFLSDNMGVVCAGGNEVTLFSRLLENGNGEKWTALSTFASSEDKPVMVVTVCMGSLGAHGYVDILCAELTTPTVTSRDSALGVATYKWVRVTFKVNPLLCQVGPEDVDSFKILCSFQSKSVVLYAAFQHQSSSEDVQLLLISETTPLVDSNKPEEEESEPKIASEQVNQDAGLFSEPDHHRGLGYKKEDYKWVQTETDITISFELAADVHKRDISCVIAPAELVVGLTDGTTLLRGEPTHAVDPEASTWTIQDNM